MASAGPSSSGESGPGHSQVQDHIEEEFGKLKNTEVQFHSGPASSADGSVDAETAAACATAVAEGRAPTVCARHDRVNARQLRRLRRKLFAPRWLRQYFPQEGVLRREAVRKERKEEDLYLDLIVVAAIAALSHELRHHFFEDGWASVENFILLFGALYSSWRTLMFLWNSFGTKGDLVDKGTVFAVQVCMAGIGLGATAAFGSARIPVALASFMATVIPSVMFGYYSYRAEQGHNEHNIFHQGLGHSAITIVAALPYFAAVFIKSESGARACYWAAFFLLQLALPAYVAFYNKLHAAIPLAARIAINVENMAEKYGVLTLVVLGESLMALLFEGSDILRKEGTDVANTFIGVFMGVVIIYSLMTLYFDVDNHITRKAVHAFRYKRSNGLLWSHFHIYYHMSLAGFLSTGIGLMLKDVALEAKVEAAKAVKLAELSPELLASISVHAAAESVKTKNEFDGKARWLFSGGWMAAVILSSFMGLAHKPGKRGRTKNRRIYPRIFFALLAGIGLPFLEISAMRNLIAFTVISFVFAFVEFVAIRMDAIGMLSRTGPPMSVSSPTSSIQDSLDTGSHDDWFGDESEEMDPADDTEVEKPGIDVEGGNPADCDPNTEALRASARRDRQRYVCILLCVMM